MPGQFQCRFCPEIYSEVLEFLDHFEIHMNQDESKENNFQNVGYDNQNVIPKSENNAGLEKVQTQSKNGCIKNSQSESESSGELEVLEKKSNCCETCEKTFLRKHALKSHIKNHTWARGGWWGVGPPPLRRKFWGTTPLTTLDPGPRGVVNFWPPKAAENFFTPPGEPFFPKSPPQ